MAKSQFIEKIRQNSLIELDPSFEKFFIEHGTIKYLPGKKTIIRKGDELKYLVIAIDDNLKLYQEGVGDASEKLVGYLQVGRSLMLRPLLAGKKASYSVKTESPGSVLVVPREKFVDQVKKVPGLSEYLRLMGINSGVRDFKKYLESQKVSFAQILQVFSMIDQGVKLNPKKENIEVADHIYFCARGEYRLQYQNKAYYLGESSWWGGKNLVDNESYKVRTQKDCVFHSLSIQKLKKVADQSVIDLVFSDPFLDKFQEDKELTPLQMEKIDRSLSKSEKKFIADKFDQSNFVTSQYKEDYFEKFAANYSQICGIDFDHLAFNRLYRFNQISIGEVGKVFDSMGFIVRSVLKEEEDSHYILLYQGRLLIHLMRDGGKSYFWDTVSGVIRLTQKETAGIERLVITHAKLEHIEDRLTLTSFRGLVGELVPKQNHYLKSLMVLLVMITAFDMFIPKITEYIIDDVLPSKDYETLWVCLGGLFICSVFNLVLGTFSSIVVSVYGGEIENKLAGQFYHKILNLHENMVKKIEIGGMLNRISDLMSIRDFLIQEFIVLLESSLKLILACGFLFYYGWQIAMIAIVMIPLSIGLRFLFKNRIKKLYDEAFEFGSKSQSLITEVISSIITVKSSGSEKNVQKKWEDVTLGSIEKVQEAELTNAKLSLVLGLTTNIIKILCIWFGVKLALEGSVSGGSIIAISMYLNIILGAINSLAGLITSVETLNVTLDKVSDVICEPPEESAAKSRASHSLQLEGKVQFENVNFRYGDDLPWVLKDLNFTIYPHQTIAIVGKSGSGKTTLAKMMVGLLAPSSGRILFDNFDMQFISLKVLREQIGYLPQHNHLFAGSIKENISINSDFLDLERMNFSAEIANAKEFIFKFPGNYDQYLAEGGLGLSGGERQRLALARLIYNDPKIIVLDESTSALDAESEMEILDSVEKVMHNKTVVIIAHRLSTIKNADQILVIDNGEVVEVGNHNELVEQGGFYLKLFENQISLGEVI